MLNINEDKTNMNFFRRIFEVNKHRKEHQQEELREEIKEIVDEEIERIEKEKHFTIDIVFDAPVNKN